MPDQVADPKAMGPWNLTRSNEILKPRIDLQRVAMCVPVEKWLREALKKGKARARAPGSYVPPHRTGTSKK